MNENQLYSTKIKLFAELVLLHPMESIASMATTLFHFVSTYFFSDLCVVYCIYIHLLPYRDFFFFLRNAVRRIFEIEEDRQCHVCFEVFELYIIYHVLLLAVVSAAWRSLCIFQKFRISVRKTMQRSQQSIAVNLQLKKLPNIAGKSENFRVQHFQSVLLSGYFYFILMITTVLRFKKLNLKFFLFFFRNDLRKTYIKGRI